MSNTNDVSVFGAGPAGLVAAVSLATAGRRVTLYERKSSDDDRAAGGWRILDNWTRERLALHVLRELFTPAPWRDSLLSVAAGRLHPFRDEQSSHGNTCDCIRCRHGSAEDLSHLAGCFADRADA
jgi:flavin-dependent dehydrogenase